MMGRFSLSRFLAFVAAVCVSVATTVKPNAASGYVWGVLLIGVLCYGCTYIAIGGPRRGYWAGVVAFVTINALVIEFPISFLPHPAPHLAGELSAALVKLPVPQPFARAKGSAPEDPLKRRLRMIEMQNQQDQAQNQVIGQRREVERSFLALSLLWIGALGGWVGQSLAARKEAR